MTDTRKAATAVLMREGNRGAEVLMLKRSGHGVFGNMWVFPGGAIDSSEERAHVDIIDAARHAVIRETREEAALDITDIPLYHFSHWTPPEGFSTRFLTWFFIGQVKKSQPVYIDNHEVVDYVWADPGSAIARHQESKMPMAPPTVLTLSELASHQCCGEILTHYRQRGVAFYNPKIVKTGSGDFVSMYQEDAGYHTGNPSDPGPRHRLECKGGVCRYIVNFADNMT